MNRQTVIIIGGGLGGLFTGALLAKEGYSVTVVEKNTTAGGGLQTFQRAGVSFDTGMHMLGGLRPGGSVRKICHYLGIDSRLELLPCDADCMDSIVMGEDTYRVPEGREAFTEYFAQRFPDEADNVRRYVEALYQLADEVDFFYLRTGKDDLFSHSEKFLWSASDFIAYYIKDERLRDVLAYMNPMYGGVAGRTPAYIHALINVLYINGQDRFVGSSQQLADALVDVITQGGGQVVTGQRVTRLHIDSERRCTGVTTDKGASYSADCYISAIHPQQLITIADAGAFPKSYRQRVASIPNSYSAFSVYIKFRDGVFPYINHTYDPTDEAWPHGFMYMTPPEHNQGPWATKMIINCLMPFSAVRQWEHTTVGRRGEDYELWKQHHVDRIFSRMEQLYPGFGHAVENVWSSSPLTIRDYYGQPDGALYGIVKDCQNIMLSQLPIWTKVKNLLLTGQNVNLHGICGVPLTAVNTVEALIGQNKLVEKINNLYNHTYGKN